MSSMIGNADAGPAPRREFIDLKIHTQLPSPHTVLHFHNIKVTSSIRDLKDHLRQTLPNNPAPATIKFIYRGHRVRNDSDTLETILTPAAVQQEATHTLHCVLQDPFASTPTRTPTRIPALAPRSTSGLRPGSTTPHLQPVPGSQLPVPPRYSPVQGSPNGTPLPGPGFAQYQPPYRTPFQQPMLPQSHFGGPSQSDWLQAMHAQTAQMQAQIPTSQAPFTAAATGQIRHLENQLREAHATSIQTLAQESMNQLDASSERLHEAVQLLQNRLQELRQPGSETTAEETQRNTASRSAADTIETAMNLATTSLEPQVNSLRERVQALRQSMANTPPTALSSSQTGGDEMQNNENPTTAQIESSIPPQTQALPDSYDDQPDAAATPVVPHLHNQHGPTPRAPSGQSFTQQGTGPNGVSWTFTSTTTSHEFPQQPGLPSMLQPHQPGTAPQLDFANNIMPGLSIFGGPPQTPATSSTQQWLSASYAISTLDDLQYQLQRTIEGFWRLSNLHEPTPFGSAVRRELAETTQRITAIIGRRNAIQQNVNSILADGPPPGHSQPSTDQIATLQNLSERFSNAVSNFTSECQSRSENIASAERSQGDGSVSSQQPVAYLFNTPRGPYGFMYSSQGSYSTETSASNRNGSATQGLRQPNMWAPARVGLGTRVEPHETISAPDNLGAQLNNPSQASEQTNNDVAPVSNVNTAPPPQAADTQANPQNNLAELNRQLDNINIALQGRAPAQLPQHFGAQGSIPYYHPFDHPNAPGFAQQHAQVHPDIQNQVHNWAQQGAQQHAQQHAQLHAHNHTHNHNHAQLNPQQNLAHNHNHNHNHNHPPFDPANPLHPGANPHPNPDDPNVRAIAINLTPLLQALWFFIRIYGVMWILLGGIGTTWRAWILVATTIVYWAVQAGVGREYVEFVRGWWEGIVGPGGVGGRDNAAAGGGANANVNANAANVAPGAGAAPTRPTGAAAAPQATGAAGAQNRPRTGNAIREALRPLEQTLALLIASLWPGVGERHVAERERVRREEVEREIEARRREEEQREGVPAGTDADAESGSGVAGEGQGHADGQDGGVSSGVEATTGQGGLVQRGVEGGAAAEARPNP